MNLLHRPLQLADLSSIIHAVQRKVHRNHEKTRTRNGAANAGSLPGDVGGGGDGGGDSGELKVLPLTPAEAEAEARLHDVERQLAQAQEDARRHEAECARMAAANDQLTARLTQLDCLPQQARELQKKLEQEAQAAHKAWELYEGAVGEAQGLQARLAQLEEDVRRGGARASELERAREDAERQRRSSLDLLEARTTELREAQVFLAKTDDITDGEVGQLVDTLNARVAQTAAAVARAPEFRYESALGRDGAAVEKAVRRIEHYGWLPAGLLATLRAADHTRSTALVQTGLQAGMVMYARWLATTWELGVIDPRGLLEGVYLQMREREPQSVAGRWRALCRTHVKALLDTGEAQTQRLFKSISGIVADVLVICGAAGGWDHISEVISQGYEADLHEIVSLALQFQWTAGERIVSRDFIVFVEEPDAIFDPSRMEDERADGKKAPYTPARKGRVVCTTHLGLMVERKVGGKHDVGEVESRILSKPKVVLKTGIDRSASVS